MYKDLPLKKILSVILLIYQTKIFFNGICFQKYSKLAIIIVRKTKPGALARKSQRAENHNLIPMKTEIEEQSGGEWILLGNQPFASVYKIVVFFIFIFKMRERWEHFCILTACVQAVLEDILAMSNKQHALVTGKC